MQVQRRFRWRSGGSSSGGVCLRKWSDLCSPIECGGLGIRRLSQLDEAFLTKLAWRMVSCSDLLSKFSCAKYCKSGGGGTPVISQLIRCQMLGKVLWWVSIIIKTIFTGVLVMANR